MSTVAKVKTYMDDKPALNYMPSPADGVMIECEVINPPSMVGRTVYVHVPGPVVTTLLLELRNVARLQRRDTL